MSGRILTIRWERMSRYAAIDIGSNSVRMLAAETGPGPTKILAAERQVTRLGASVFQSGRISREAIEFVTETLTKMAQIYRKYDVIAVRAVATSAVRDASNQDEFLARAAEALGAPVEIISGQEEARLIHLGVQARWPQSGKRVLMIDIGGGSAELILSEHGVIEEAFSKPLGSVRLSEVFLKSDPATPPRVAPDARVHRREARHAPAPHRNRPLRPRDRDFSHGRGRHLRRQSRNPLAPR